MEFWNQLWAGQMCSSLKGIGGKQSKSICLVLKRICKHTDVGDENFILRGIRKQLWDSTDLLEHVLPQMKSLNRFLLPVLFLSTGILFAQHETCELTPKTHVLHVNHIRAHLSNRGHQFSGDRNRGFQVPYRGQETPSAFFIDNLWIAGFDSDANLLEKIPDYPSHEYCGYAPGPIDLDDPLQTARQWNKIFSVRRDQILAHIEDYSDGIIDDHQADIFGWPAKGNVFFEAYNGFELHPDVIEYGGFHETPGNQNGIYEPHLGEYPLPEGVNENAIPSETIYRLICTLSGDKVDWEVPLADVHHTTYAYNCDDELLNHSLFSQYRVVNRSSDTLYQCRIGWFADVNIGNPFDDYFGCDPENQVVYFYNTDNVDEDIRHPGYGQNPPVVSMTILGEEQKLHSVMPLFRGDSFPIPLNGYPLLNATWPDGTPLTQDGTGYNPGSTDSVNYAFTDVPDTSRGWSMLAEKINQYQATCIISTIPEKGGS
ncbi:MAG: hypothetical protein R3275_03645, partial [Saprospiraceae bacterium]|nr:hypothetical protein [Saprospiraceae bacterium]